MQKLIISLSVCALSLFGFSYEMKPVQLSSDIHCFFGKNEVITKENGGNIVNTCFISTDNGYIVVDSGPTWLYAKEAHEAMQKISDKPVTHVINTHHHDDHWLGNGYYKSIGAKLIGPKSVPFSVTKETQTRMQRNVSEAAYANTKIVYPETIVEEHMTLEAGDKKIELIVMPHTGHTKSDLIVHIPGAAIFAGDLIFNERILSVRDGSVKGWLKDIDLLIAYDAPLIVGGHGHTVGKDAYVMTRDYLISLKEAVRKALDEDVGLDEVTGVVTMDRFKSLELYDVLHKQNVLTAYGELEFEGAE